MDYSSIGIVPLIIGIIEVAKKIGLPIKLAPLVAIILGVAGAFLLENGAISQKILLGIVFGLSSSGLYSGGKAVIKPKVTD